MKEEKIIKNIIQIRNSKGFTKKQMAEMLCMSEPTYGRIENGKVSLEYSVLSEIATVLKMPVIDIITYPDVYVPNTYKPSNTKVLVELEVSPDEFIKMGLKDKVIQVLEK